MRKYYIITKIQFSVANWSGKLGQDVVRNHVKKALNQWGKYGRLYFKEIFDPSADIIIAFGTGYHGDMYVKFLYIFIIKSYVLNFRFPFDGKGNILAHAFFPYELEGYGGDVHFDDDEDWKEYPNTEDGKCIIMINLFLLFQFFQEKTTKLKLHITHYTV